MNVVEYLKQHGIAALEAEFAIKVKSYPEGLLVLNYDQIYSSPKAHPIIVECRGLILDTEFNVVSHPFDRFFNYGEQPETQTHLDISKAVCYEKIDGSLIKIYYFDGLWRIATRGTAFAESGVNGFDITFKEIVLKALQMTEEQFQHVCNTQLDSAVTFICEVTSVENRVVKAYSGYNLYYLAARNKDGEYEDWEFQCLVLGMKLPTKYYFSDVSLCLDTAKHLKDLDEGYVLYQDGVPCAKIKSPVYVAVHSIRGEGLSPKRIAQIVLSGESDEYLKYFPEDEGFFLPYFAAKESLEIALHSTYYATMDIEGQKEFAIAVKDEPFSAVLFQCRKNGTSPYNTFEDQSEQHKIRMLEAFLEAA